MGTPILKAKSIIFGILILTCISCSKEDVFSEFKAINPDGWHKDSLTTFSVPIDDSKIGYNIYVNVRHTNEYSYQNFWIFISLIHPDGEITKDTIECYLADQRGQWLGSGVGQWREMSVLYQQDVRFPKTGEYHYKIVHGMRDTILSGISDIGLRIEKIKK